MISLVAFLAVSSLRADDRLAFTLNGKLQVWDEGRVRGAGDSEKREFQSLNRPQTVFPSPDRKWRIEEISPKLLNQIKDEGKDGLRRIETFSNYWIKNQNDGVIEGEFGGMETYQRVTIGGWSPDSQSFVIQGRTEGNGHWSEARATYDLRGERHIFNGFPNSAGSRCVVFLTKNVLDRTAVPTPFIESDGRFSPAYVCDQPRDLRTWTFQSKKSVPVTYNGKTVKIDKLSYSESGTRFAWPSERGIFVGEVSTGKCRLIKGATTPTWLGKDEAPQSQSSQSTNATAVGHRVVVELRAALKSGNSASLAKLLSEKQGAELRRQILRMKKEILTYKELPGKIESYDANLSVVHVELEGPRDWKIELVIDYRTGKITKIYSERD